MNLLEWLFGAASFVPHGVCLLWRPDLVALHAVSDVLIALAYFAIPAAIWWFVKRRKDLTAEHRRIAVLFSAFIVWCGVTHLGGLITLWAPFYGLQGLIKATTAAVSVVTAFAVWPILPKLLEVPSPAALAAANAKLTEALAELEAVKADLERQVAERTEDVRLLNVRFERALEGSLICVFEQDEDLVYTWIHNPPAPLTPETVVGRTDADVMNGEAAEIALVAKRRAFAEGGVQEAQFAADFGGETRWWLLNTAPSLLRDGRPGLLSVGVDVTAQVRQQEHLQVIMRELNHRTKNLLAMVQAIARQTGRGATSVEDFQGRFTERLQALADGHDLLVAADWSGADVRALVERQLREELKERPDRIEVSGPSVVLPPAGAHYFGLALHELHVNAVKHGALSGEAGRVRAGWRRKGGKLVFVWEEHDGPAVSVPSRKGFGRTLLETLAPGAMRGRAALSFPREGVRYELVAALDEGPSSTAGRGASGLVSKAASQSATAATASTR